MKINPHLDLSISLDTCSFTYMHANVYVIASFTYMRANVCHSKLKLIAYLPVGLDMYAM